MCGICGIISYDGVPVREELVRKMCQAFACRGPDDEGVYTFDQRIGQGEKISIGIGHKRLSIIDLSASGHQPMSNEDGSIWITYNGEIYNFKEQRIELQRKGHALKSHTDTEIILHLYEEEGPQCVHRLNGMFSFALWDKKTSRLWLCRDRIGIKPLVYYWDGKHFAFASEIKSLLNDPVIPRELDYDALLLYLAFNYVPAPYTIFKGIRKLEPGYSLILEKCGLEIEKYWDVQQEKEPKAFCPSLLTQEELIKRELYEYLSEAVRKRMIADVPLGAFLSGGLDSSIIVGLMARDTSQPVKTFSIGFKDDRLFDETHYAREVSHLYKTDHHEFKLTYRDMLDALPDVLSSFDEPFADSSAIPTYIVSRETKNYVTVALSGDGGDELFAGYRSYLGEYWYKKYMMVPAIIREGLIKKIFQVLPDSRDAKVTEYIRRFKKFIGSTKGDFHERVMSLKEVFPQELRKNLLLPKGFGNNISEMDLPLEMVKSRLASYRGDKINKILYSDLKDSLPGDMLTKVDWMSMKNSLEVRVPFLDHNVVEFAFRIPGSIKLHRGKTKYLLKETFKDLLPRSLYSRPKAGFEIPISRWLKTDLRFLIEEFLGEKRIKEEGIFEYDTISCLKKAFFANKTDTSWMLWNLIVFEYWHGRYLC